MIINYKEVDIQREEQVVLYNVNLQIHEGEFVYLTGVVGSGKTSLLKTIYGELDITTGSADVLGRDMLTLRRRQVPKLRRELGIVFQDFRLLTDRNVRQNLDFVLQATGWTDRTARANRISEVLQTVGLADKLEVMPYELSGGEQQRICIARAILNKPKLILADEATGNQDAESGRQTTKILHDLSKEGTAVIMATHNTLLLEQFPGTVYECRDHRLLCVSAPASQPLSANQVIGEEETAREEETFEGKATEEGEATGEGATQAAEAAAKTAASEGAASQQETPDDIPVATILPSSNEQ
ncbi:MAG: ATP-binding cassette domain-containing protein [Bacteroidaceae bacterium]|nr:ATP-binding cassette domain-containing protein [Bacteroidaceae bacterium]